LQSRLTHSIDEFDQWTSRIRRVLLNPGNRKPLRDFKVAAFNARVGTVEDKATFRFAFSGLE
jgi:hypothetical protein